MKLGKGGQDWYNGTMIWNVIPGFLGRHMVRKTEHYSCAPHWPLGRTLPLLYWALTGYSK